MPFSDFKEYPKKSLEILNAMLKNSDDNKINTGVVITMLREIFKTIEENTDTGTAQAAQIADSVGNLVEEMKTLGGKIDHFVDLHTKMLGYLSEYFKMEIEFSKKNLAEAKKEPTKHDAMF